MPRSQRRLIASIVIMLFLAILGLGRCDDRDDSSQTARNGRALLFFVVAGIGWALPLKPVFTWMNSGPEEE